MLTGSRQLKVSVGRPSCLSGRHALVSRGPRSQPWQRGQEPCPGLGLHMMGAVSRCSLSQHPCSGLPRELPLVLFRITSNRNHTRENGNAFSSLLGWLSLVHLSVFLLSGPDRQPAALWEPSVGACGDCGALALWVGRAGTVLFPLALRETAPQTRIRLVHCFHLAKGGRTYNYPFF